MSDARMKFQELLRELFQFDCADLDFGIYRIMNQKRAVIEHFIEKDLLDAVGKELRKGALKEQGDLADQLATLAEKIREDIADDAIDADGRLAEAHAKTKLGKQYIELQGNAAGATASDDIEAQVFNHLWAFFSRYFDNGDFLSTRRYSRREKYAIPYNGEEVFLHWANRDQYYIKTGEQFTDYQWKAGDVTVLFKLVQAETEKDNVKSDTKRLFVPRLDEVTVETRVEAREELPAKAGTLTGGNGSECRLQAEVISAASAAGGERAKARAELPAKAGTLTGGERAGVPPSGGSSLAASAAVVTIPFEYRGLTEQEAIAFGKKNQQEAIIVAALESLPKRKALREAPAALAAIMAEYRKTGKGEYVSRLEHHLRRYTGKNTRDYFIHKDLEGFLTRELDFYLKNEVLSLDDLTAGGAERAEGWFQLLEAIRAVGGKIVAFLAQIENFQKRVFEKRKFVTETNYCFTLDRVPKALWPAVLKNKAQIAEWQKLCSIQDLKGYSDPLKPAFLEAWPSLMVDTVFFAEDAEFMDALLAGQKDLDESLGGLLVHSENFQALNVILPRFKEQVKCIYIDPPYNTGSDGFPYKDNFRHSSWLAMLRDRMTVAAGMQSTPSPLFVSLDDNEAGALRFLAESTYAGGGFVAVCIWHKMYAPKSSARQFSEDHDYIFVFAKGAAGWTPNLLPRTDEQDAAYKNPDSDPRGLWRPNNLAARNPYSRGRYSIRCPGGRLIEGPPPGSYWRISEEKFKELDKDGRIWWGKGGNNVPAPKIFLSEVKAGRVPQTIWHFEEVGHTQEAKKQLIEMGLIGDDDAVFSTAKPTRLLGRVLTLGDGCEGEVVLDYFAGTGSFGHAALERIRTDAPTASYVLVEMGSHFNTVLKPRLQKVVFSSAWKEGKPVLAKDGKTNGLSHAFKYIRLESYEDALGNIAFDEAQGALKFDDYVLRYMLGFETRKSETLLNVEKLAAPFSYKLDILDGGERKTKPVDLPETFNWLLGLKVSSRKVHLRDAKLRYLVIHGTTNPHGEGGERKVCVIWRDVTGWKAADFKADAEFVKTEKLAAGADEVFVNADVVGIPAARVLDGVFKERMFAPVAV